MMSDKPFSSKLSQGVKRSLAQRVFLLCVAFLVLPLLIYSLILWDKQWHLDRREVASQLESYGRSTQKQILEWMKNTQMALGLITIPPTSSDLAAQGEKLEASALFFLENREGGWEVTASSDPQMIGNRDFSLGESENFAFLTPDSEILIIRKAPEGVLGVIKKERDWFDSTLFEVTLSKESFSNDELKKWQEQRGFLTFWRFEKAPSLHLKLPGADFSLQVTIPESQLASIEGLDIFTSLWHFLLILVAIGGGITLWLTLRMSRPLKQLQTTMERVEKGDTGARYHFDRFGFEFNVLGAHFNEALIALQRQIEIARSERLAKEVYASELELGHEIQKSLFPTEIPHLSGLEIGAGFLPAREVAGDFYDLFLVDKDHLLLVMADGSDKGISACLYGLLVRSLLRSQISVQRDLGRAVQEVNNLFCLDTKETGNFVTAWIGLYHLKTKELDYCCAGHPPALLFSGEECQQLSSEEWALGALEMDRPAYFRKIQLKKGDLLVLYTDGILEAEDKSGNRFGKGALMNFLKESKMKTPQELVDELLSTVDHYSQGVGRQDDLTALSLRS